MDLAVLTYELARRFPNHERYGPGGQLTRSAASVPANIAEGNARSTPRDYAQFVSIAKGSLMEAETYVLLAARIGYVTEEMTSQILALIIEISRMLTALRARLLN
jgi:four helix bundle protein